MININIIGNITAIKTINSPDSMYGMLLHLVCIIILYDM